MKLSKKLSSRLDDYENYHHHPSNKLTHYFGIPMIIVGSLALLLKVQLGSIYSYPVSAATLALILVNGWAVLLDFFFGWIYSAIIILFYVLALFVSPLVAITLFVVGWALQLIGHYHFEKKSPALTENLLQALIGPMWILARALRLR
jgi:uncharacterized membrane protein YGL010W